MLALLFLASCTADPKIAAQVEALEIKEAQEPPTQMGMEALAKEYAALAAGGDWYGMQEHIAWVDGSLHSQLAALPYSEAGDAAHAYAHAMLLRRIEGDDAMLAALKTLHERDPKFAPALLQLARREKKENKFTKEYLALCPDTAPALELALDKHATAAAAKKLRRILEKETAAEMAPFLRTLWAAEFKTLPQQARDHVRADLARMQAAPLTATTAYELDDGYKMLGAHNERDALRERTIKELPFGGVIDSYIFDEREGHVTPSQEDSLDDKRAALKKSQAKAKGLVERWPRYVEAWRFLFEVTSNDAATTTDALNAAEHLLEFQHAYPDAPQWGVPIQTQIAQLYLLRDAHLADVAALLDEGERVHAAHIAEAKTVPSEIRDMVAKSDARTSLTQARLRIELALAQKNAPAAQTALTAANKIESKRNPYEEGLDHCLTGRVLALNGAHADAFAELQKATVALAAPKTLQGEELRLRCADALQAEWKKLGGSASSLALFTPASQPVDDKDEGWEVVDKPVPAFALKDLAGKTWSSKQLQGKTTYIDLWASWCGPCRMELPYLETLLGLTAGTRLQVWTFNLDENPGAIPEALEKVKLTAPVILASEFVDGFSPVQALPTAWIVNARGRIIAERKGFSPKKTWVNETLQKMKGEK